MEEEADQDQLTLILEDAEVKELLANGLIHSDGIFQVEDPKYTDNPQTVTIVGNGWVGEQLVSKKMTKAIIEIVFLMAFS